MTAFTLNLTYFCSSDIDSEFWNEMKIIIFIIIISIIVRSSSIIMFYIIIFSTTM